MSEITRNPLCWPNNVARTPPGQRTWPRFEERTVSTAVGMILHEINRLNGRNWDFRDEQVIISSNLKLKLDGLPGSNQVQPMDSGAAVYFQLRFLVQGKYFFRPIVMTCDRWNKVEYNLVAIAKDIEAQRARTRWGCTNMQQAFQGYVAIPERCGGKAWWDILGVKSSASESEISAAYGKLAKQRHPDMVGGSEEAFHELREALNQALARFLE